MEARIEEKKHGPGYMAKKLRDTEEKLINTKKQLADVKEELKRKNPRVTQITPVAQAIEIAKSEVNQAGRLNQADRETHRVKSRISWNNY